MSEGAKRVRRSSRSRSSPTARTARASSTRRDPLIKGFTTNPTLMRKAGITDYEAFAREVLELIPTARSRSRCSADDFDEMERQAREIATWGENVYVKIPVTNTRRRARPST